MDNNNNFNNFTNLSHFEEEALNNNLNNFNNNLNPYGESVNVTTAEFLRKIPEDIDSDNRLAYIIHNKNAYNLFKNTSYYKYFKAITNTIIRLKNFISENTFIFEKNPENFSKLKIYILNILKKLDSYLNNYRGLYENFDINEETGYFNNDQTDAFFVNVLLSTKDELIKNSGLLFPELYSLNNLDNEEFDILNYDDDEDIYEDDENSYESSSSYSASDRNENSDENLSKYDKNNIKPIKNKNKSF